MFLKLIKRLKGKTAFRLSATIAVVLLINMVGFNYFIQPRIRTEILKKEQRLIQFKLNQYVSLFKTSGYDSLIEELRKTEQEAKLIGLLVRIIDTDNTVLWLSYPDDTATEALTGNMEPYHSNQGDVSRFMFPDTSRPILKSFLMGQRDRNHLIVYLSERLDDTLTIQVGHTFRRVNEATGMISTLFRYVNFFFTTVIFLCSVVIIQWGLSPLKDLLKTIQKISSGEMTARVRLRNRKDDIEQMAIMFNHMLDKTESLVTRMKESLDNVAHDLRTPLSRMRLSIEGAVQKEDPESLKEALFDCAEEAEKLERFLKTMMNISEAEAETLNLYTEEIDLKEMIHESLKQYDYLLEDKKLDVVLNLKDNLHVIADPSRIQQVFNNLIDNAIKYTSEGGRIEIFSKDNNRSALMVIKDNGVGIRYDDLDRIFERLYRADKSRSTKGLGLGLSLVRAVLKAHRGEIRVQSKPDQGSEFQILIPKNFQKDAQLDWSNALK